jgi:biotin synthase
VLVVRQQVVVATTALSLVLHLPSQAMAFLAGANSIFDGDKLLTTANNDR